MAATPDHVDKISREGRITPKECVCKQIPYSPYAKNRKSKLSVMIRQACICGRFP